MKETRRKYTEEFKREAVALVTEHGRWENTLTSSWFAVL